MKRFEVNRMKEYIEKQQAIDAAREDGKKIPTLAIRIMHDIKAIPAADVVPVVRCKDCKWYGRADKRRFYRGMDCLQKRIDTIVPDRDFCSRAERKKNGQ